MRSEQGYLDETFEKNDSMTESTVAQYLAQDALDKAKESIKN